jgi:hypothetical protein
VRSSSILLVTADDDEDDENTSTNARVTAVTQSSVLTPQLVEEKNINIEILFGIRSCSVITQYAKLKKITPTQTFDKLCSDIISS